MAKGAVYAAIKTPNLGTIHVFNTHLNAWTSPKAAAARLAQCEQLGSFIAAQQIPADEMVFVGGDINVDIWEHPSTIAEMSKLLGGVTFYTPEDVSFSSDPLTNALVGTDDAAEYATESLKYGCYDQFMQSGVCPCCPRQLLDLVGTKTSHRSPLSTTFEVLPTKSRSSFLARIGLYHVKELSDVSDHFPVVLRAVCAERSLYEEENDTGHGNNEVDYQPANTIDLTWSLILTLFTFAFFIILFTLMIGIRNMMKHRRRRVSPVAT